MIFLFVGEFAVLFILVTFIDPWYVRIERKELLKR